jgi:hypothetical protein
MVMTHWREMVRNERGAVLVMLALSMVALLGSAALAIDVGALYMARTEAQRVADASALAGAGWLLTDPDDSAGARLKAIDYAARNTVRHLPASVLPTDIDVNLDSSLFRVRVILERDRGNAVPTVFARILGIDLVNIATVAAAWAAPADELPEAADCPLPIALPDRWIDVDGDGGFDPGVDSYQETSGYSDADIGTLVALKVSGSNDKGPPSCRPENESSLVSDELCRELPDSDNWRCWYQEEDGAGGGTDALGPMIYPGTECAGGLGVGDPVWAASGSGNKKSMVESKHEDFGGSCTTTCATITNPDGTTSEDCTVPCPTGSFSDLIRADPDLVWDGGKGCVVNSGDPSTCVESSPRIRKVPIVRPDQVLDTGSGVTTNVVDFTGVFVERVSCNYDLGDFGGPAGNWNVYVRLVRAPVSGSGDGGNGPDKGDTTLKTLRLIE